MAAKDSPVIGKVFGGVGQDNTRCPAIVQQNQKGYKSKKGAAYPALKKITQFLQQLSDVFVELAKTIRSLSKTLVSFIGLVLIAAALVLIIKAIILGKPLPIESLIIPIVRVSLSQIWKK